MRWNKKGSFLDLFVFMGSAFAMMIFIVLIVYAATTTLAQLHSHSNVIQTAIGDNGNATTIIDETFGQVPNAFTALRWISVLMIFGMMLSILISNFLVRTNPVFFIPYVFILILAVVISVPISNTYETLMENTTLASTFAQFYASNWIFLHLPIWIAIIGILGGIIMYVNMVRSE